MSPASRYARFQSGLSELSPALLEQLTAVDHASHVAFVAHLVGDTALIAEARYVLDESGTTGELAIAVTDAWQRQGLGARMLDALIATALSAGVARLEGEVLRTNTAMRTLAARSGFAPYRHPESRKVAITRTLGAAVSSRA